MSRLIAVIVLNLAMSLALGCGSGEQKPVEVDVQGKVTLDKKPLKEGTIVFITSGQPGDSIDITGGAYAGKARVGENRRVEIYAYKEGPLEKNPMTDEMVKSRIPLVAPKYNVQSTLKATVAEGADNAFNFDVTSP